MRIAIDLGHGVGQDRGAEGFVTEESIINAVGSLVIAKLKALGHSVIEVRPQYANSVSDSLIKRVDLANANNVDLFISIHANAGGGRGTEVFTYRGNELEQARNVLNNLESLGFIKVDEKGNKISRGIKSSNLYVINKTEARAMLIEICFVDTKADMELYNSIGAEKVANAIVKGLVGETVTIAPIDKKEHIQEQYKGSTWVSRLQYIIGANKDGIAGKETLSKCPVLKKGSVGDVVKLLQENLKIIADGIFGTNTREAVLAFQINNGLVVDGIVGKKTWGKLLGLK